MNKKILTISTLILFGLGITAITSCGNTEKKQGHETHQHDEDGHEDHHDHKEDGHDHN